MPKFFYITGLLLMGFCGFFFGLQGNRNGESFDRGIVEGFKATHSKPYPIGDVVRSNSTIPTGTVIYINPLTESIKALIIKRDTVFTMYAKDLAYLNL